MKMKAFERLMELAPRQLKPEIVEKMDEHQVGNDLKCPFLAAPIRAFTRVRHVVQGAFPETNDE